MALIKVNTHIIEKVNNLIGNDVGDPISLMEICTVPKVGRMIYTGKIERVFVGNSIDDSCFMTWFRDGKLIIQRDEDQHNYYTFRVMDKDLEKHLWEIGKMMAEIN